MYLYDTHLRLDQHTMYFLKVDQTYMIYDDDVENHPLHF